MEKLSQAEFDENVIEEEQHCIVLRLAYNDDYILHTPPRGTKHRDNLLIHDFNKQNIERRQINKSTCMPKNVQN